MTDKGLVQQSFIISLLLVFSKGRIVLGTVIVFTVRHFDNDL